MKVQTTQLEGVLLLECPVWPDARGFLSERFNAEAYAKAGIPGRLDQTLWSRSLKNVVRGLHFQEPNPQGKLVHVTQGAVFDVAVDIRKSSKTFGRWVGFELSADNHRQLWVPPGYAHGFCVLSEFADVQYQIEGKLDAAAARVVRWDDPAIGIRWPLSGAPVLAPKDANAPLLREAHVST